MQLYAPLLIIIMSMMTIGERNHPTEGLRRGASCRHFPKEDGRWGSQWDQWAKPW